MNGERPSKTERKKQMHDLQDLGAALVALRADELDALALPERLHDAVLEARRVTKFEARRRQMQYIGKLMRGIDPEPIRAQLATRQAATRAHAARFHLVEEWRTRLLTEDDALGKLTAAYPGADAARLQTLVRDAQSEKARGQPPRSYRTLFKALRDIVASRGAADDTA